ncbi:hypothetical protein KJ632_03755 [Patescibacteria group bacterium]|nr:hypothetical protein [Patescibacteria group bacterium]
MADENTQQGQVQVDPNKSPEQYIKEAEAHYIVPRLVRDEFPDLVKLIFETESMNEEEREYWLQIMPIMAKEQILKFREILINEKDELTKLDQEYEQEMTKINAKKNVELNEEELKAKLEYLKNSETEHEQAENEEEANLLDQLNSL